MPKVANPLLRSEILSAAGRLLDRGSDSAVTMRAVAEEAGIAVTTVYERFDGREGLMRALAVHLAEDEARRLLDCKTMEELFDRYLEFAQAHPYRYKLMVDSFFERLETGATLPGVELAKCLLVRRVGGTPEQHEELALGIIELMAGAMTGMMAAGSNLENQRRAKSAAQSVLRLALRNLKTKQSHR
jgi:AcrR family transcriptional regulator